MESLEQHLQEVVSICPDPIIAVDRKGMVGLFNPAAEKLLGYASEEVVGKLSITQLYHPPEQARIIKRLIHSQEYGEAGQLEGYETRLVARGGRVVDIRLSATLIKNGLGQEVGSIGFFHDLTERKQLESRLMLLSITDSMTGLYNQRHFHHVLVTEVDRVRRYQRTLSLICVDIDNFKQVNDSLGHLEGDNAIRFAAQVIQDIIRKTDMAFRYGGDEFMVLLPEASQEEAALIAGRIQRVFDERWQADWLGRFTLPVRVGLSTGAVEFDPRESAEAFIHRADEAMYGAKKLRASAQ
jgi:diguanylate cyclase (GGDEF)-like protein/PAS domain S-box-containing protein